MTTQEPRELDAWIAEHVMGWRHAKTLDDLGVMDSFYDHGDILIEYRKGHLAPWRPTEDSADSMDVLKKCAEKVSDCEIQIIKWSEAKPEQDPWTLSGPDYGQPDMEVIQESGPTLELAICLFAKQLFSQTTK